MFEIFNESMQCCSKNMNLAPSFLHKYIAFSIFFQATIVQGQFHLRASVLTPESTMRTHFIFEIGPAESFENFTSDFQCEPLIDRQTEMTDKRRH